MAKIRAINISGLRGIKEPLQLVLNKKSMLVYGDNGTGKSSVTDAMEWFYYDGIEHLSGEEIGRKQGRDALRNIFIPDDKDAYIKIQYSDSKLDATKSIGSNLRPVVSNTSTDFKFFINASYSENLILRYRDLVKFIIAGKTDKLKELQRIIGFSEVATIRDLLRKNGARIGRNIRAAGFDSQKSSKQQVILNNLGRNAYTDEQLLEGVNELIKPLKLGKTVRTLKDIKDILKSIETKKDAEAVNQITFHTRVGELLSEIHENTNHINESYKAFHGSFAKLNKDPEKVKKLQLLALLKEGQSVLKNDVIRDDYCPLCQQEKNKIELLKELTTRIEELEELEQEKKKLDDQAQELIQTIQGNVNTTDSLLREKLLQAEEHAELKKKVEAIKTALSSISDEAKKELGGTIQEPNKIAMDKKTMAELITAAQKRAKELSDAQKSNIKLQIYTKLLQALTAYNEYQRIEKEHTILTNQQITFEALYADFIKRQENALNAFLKQFSKDINDFYTAMNPNEKVEDIKLEPIKDKNDDLVGITISYKFYDETMTPPTALLSESHINCLGLSFFLASVRAFNKQNEFVVLDDVISSFDRPHRYRFAQLLADQFSDYQVILLTHEKEFFELVSSEVKSKGWLLYNFKWSKDKGTGIEKGLADIKERIKKKFADKNTDGLGNDIRVYTEKVMKRVALEIEAKVAYRNNDVNEKRMAPELLDAVQSKISKSSSELNKEADIPKIKGMPMFVGNTTSHDNEFQESVEDLDAMWEDVKKLIHCFYCPDCDKFISLKYYDNVKKKIRCGCEKLKYDWKK